MNRTINLEMNRLRENIINLNYMRNRLEEVVATVVGYRDGPVSGTEEEAKSEAGLIDQFGYCNDRTVILIEEIRQTIDWLEERIGLVDQKLPPAAKLTSAGTAGKKYAHSKG